MTGRYSLSHLTLLDCSIPELIYIAARVGYDAVSPRLIHMGVEGESSSIPLEKEIIRATRNALNVTGLTVQDIELARITDDGDRELLKPAMEVGVELGARHLIVSVWTCEKGRDFIIDQYASICQLAQPYGLSVALEFLPFSQIKTLQSAVEIVEIANQPNGGILIDTLYVHMSRMNIKELEGLPVDWFKFIQVSDSFLGVPNKREELIEVARNSRLYPGEGCIDFSSILEQLPPLDYSIELPNRNRVKELGYEEHARRALVASKELLRTKVENYK